VASAAALESAKGVLRTDKNTIAAVDHAIAGCLLGTHVLRSAE